MDLLSKKIALQEEQMNSSKDQDIKQLQTNLRGIKTTTEVVDSYLNNLFENLLCQEQDFLDDLATPFALNPVQELTNVQILSKQAREALLKTTGQEQKMLTASKQKSRTASDE